jgi:hypothetical protein
LSFSALVKIRVNQWSNFFGASVAGLIVVFFSLLLLWHDPLIFWNDDYELSILPVFADVARSWSEGHWPLLSPYSWVCNNLAGEFQYGTFSIFVNAAVVLIWKFPLTFPQQAAALSITHLFVLAAGASLLARDRNFSFPLSIFVALIAALNGWIICWGASDWFGALGAFAWLPWAWWGLERALDQQRSHWRCLWPTLFVYLVVTGGFPYTVLMLTLLVAWLTCRAVALRGGGSMRSSGQSRNFVSILPMLFGVALGLGLSAPAWLAIFDYVYGSARTIRDANAHWQWLLPPGALPGLVLPCWTVNWADFSTHYLPHTATELACGLVAPAALIAGLIGRGRELVRRIKWDLILLLFVLVLGMLPTVSVFRWSFRWLPLFHLILALCAAEAFSHNSVQDRQVRGLTTLLFVGASAVAMLMLRFGGPYAFPLVWILLVITGIWAFAEFFLRNESLRAWTPGCLTFVALLATYFCIPPNCGVPKYNLDQALIEPTPLDPERLYLSVYPPAENTYPVEKKSGAVGQTIRLGSTSMWAGLRFINGYSPIRPAGVAREFDFAIHGEFNPHMAEYLLWSQAAPNGLLAQVGVDGIVVAWESDIGPKPESEWQLAASTEEGRVYHRIGARFAHARSVTSIESRPNEQFASATISQVNDSRNRVALDVDVPSGEHPALLTFSRPYFRGYEARLGNQKLWVGSYRSLFPLVELPAGSHGRLILVYRPWWLTYGGILSILSAMILLFGFVAAARTRFA